MVMGDVGKRHRKNTPSNFDLYHVIIINYLAYSTISSGECEHLSRRRVNLERNLVSGNKWFPYINVFWQHSVGRTLSRRSGYYLIDIFIKETWMLVGMNEISRTPKGITC